MDVLQHHDGVVHHQANGQHQGQQGQGVDGKPKQSHQGKGADQTDGDRDQGNDRGAHRAQEDKNHQGHQHGRLDDGDVDGLDGFFNEHRTVVGHRHGHARRQVLLNLGDQRAHTRREFQWIGCGLTDHPHPHRVTAVETNRGAHILSALFHAGHVLQTHGRTRHGADHQFAKLGDGLHVGGGGDVELPLLALDASSGHLQVGPAQGLLHVLDGESVGRQTVGIDPHAHGVTPFAIDAHIGSPRRGLQHRLDQAVGHVAELQSAVGVRTHGQPNHRKSVCFDLGNHRLINALGQTLAHATDFVAHIGGGRIWVATERKTHRDLAALRSAGRGDDIHPLNA